MSYQGHPYPPSGYGGQPPPNAPHGGYPPQAAGYPPQQNQSYPALAPYGQPQVQQYPPSAPYGQPAPSPYGTPAPGPYGGAPQNSYAYQQSGQHRPPPPIPPRPYPEPSAGSYNSPPPASPYGAPPASPYGAPPAGYAAAPGSYPPHPQQASAGPYHPAAPPYPQAPPPPPQQFYGAPTNYGQPALPSPGYTPGQMAPGDAGQEAEALYRAMKGFGTDERTLIRILSKRDPLQMALLVNTFGHRYGKSLQSWVESETSGYFRDTLVALIRGPLAQDVYNAHRALKGLGTKEGLLNDVVLSRSNADLNAIKQEFQRVHRRPLEQEVREDLSLKTERLFDMVLAARRAEESAPVLPQQVERDVTDVYQATEARVGADQLTVCSIFASRSDGQLRAIAHTYEQRYRKPLDRVIEKEFSGHMEDSLLMMLRGATDRAMRDAVLLEATMRGMGTKDDMLLNRIVRCHWSRDHMNQVKGAYRHRFQRELASRIQGETRGDFEKVLLACIE